MNILPFLLLPAFSLGYALALGIWSAAHGASLLPCLGSIGRTLGCSWLLFFLLGAYTTATEWAQIHTGTLRKLGYLFTFPFFLMTYLPVGIASLFCDPGWKPIVHGAGRERGTPAGRALGLSVSRLP